MQALEAGRLVRRTVRLADGAVTLEEASAPEELAWPAAVLVNTFGPEYRMLMIGRGSSPSTSPPWRCSAASR